MYHGQAVHRLRASRNILHGRIRLVIALLGLMYAMLAVRLFVLQVHDHNYYTKEANRIRLRTLPLFALRGGIYDRNGEPLAICIPVADVVADPAVINNPEATAEMLAPYFDGKLTAVAICDSIDQARQQGAATRHPVHYLRFKPALTYTQATALQAAQREQEILHRQHPEDQIDNLSGISSTQRMVRSYPNGDLAAQVLGFARLDSTGAATASYGVEKSQQSILSGRNGYITAEVDARKHPIPGTEQKDVPAVEGASVALTIDLRIQAMAQAALYQTIHDHHAESGSVVVLDPKTGEILALANMPTYDPNDVKNSTYNNWDDRAVADLYEPGSTLKTLTLSAALDSHGLQAADWPVYCSGVLHVGGHIIHCAPDPPDFGVHRHELMRDVLRNSCNIGASIYALRLGAPTLYKYIKLYGLLDRPLCGLPGAEHSRIQDPAVKRWSDIELANVSFGQGISMTPLQLISIYATLANNGVRVYPHVLLNQPPVAAPVRVVKPEVAHMMLSMLQTVVTDGTGKPAQIADFTVGGKTGSAQVPEHGHYGSQYVGSFCGVAPISNPRLVVLCVVTKPQGVHWGAVVAAPVVHDILKQALWYLKVRPDAQGQPDYIDKVKKTHQT